MDEVIIRAQELNKTFSLKRGKRVEALKDLDLTVKKGELTAIIGPDGAGKTTFMRLIAGLMDPTKGKLCVLGLDSVKEAQTIQRRISYMPQKFGLYEDLTIQENMELYADLDGLGTFYRSSCRQSVRRNETKTWSVLHLGSIAGTFAPR